VRKTERVQIDLIFRPEAKTVDKRKFLKVKLRSLMAESKIIRHEEKKTRDPELRSELYFHRIRDVRGETRSTQIAYGMLLGRYYREIERTAETTPDLKRVCAMLRKYGDEHIYNATEDTIKQWMATEPPAS
jgi:hypothetical protein